jgi:H/ACA ribonucleoprotein complex subunit 4
MSELRRTRVGSFDESKAVRIQDLADSYVLWKEKKNQSIRDFIMPVEEAVEDLGKIIVKDSAITAVASGSPLYTGGISRVQKGIVPNDLVAIMSLKGELVALARANMKSQDMLKKKGLAAKTDRVIMDKDLYPKT